MYWSNKRGELFVFHLPWSRVTNSGLTRLEERIMARKYDRAMNRPMPPEFYEKTRVFLENKRKNEN